MTQPCRQNLKVKGDIVELLPYLGKAEMYCASLFYSRAEQLRNLPSP